MNFNRGEVDYLILIRALSGLALGSPQVRLRYVATAWTSPQGGRVETAHFKGRRVLALSGIARPDAFERTLLALGVEMMHHLQVNDHVAFDMEALKTLRQLANAQGCPIVTTEKDGIRLPPDFPAWKLVMALEVAEGQPLLRAALATGRGSR